MSEFQRHFEIVGAGWEISLNYSPLTHTEPINENGTMEQSPKERWQQKLHLCSALLPVLNERGVAMALAMHSPGAHNYWRGRTSPKMCDGRQRSSHSLVCAESQAIPRCDLEASL